MYNKAITTFYRLLQGCYKVVTSIRIVIRMADPEFDNWMTTVTHAT